MGKLLFAAIIFILVVSGGIFWFLFTNNDPTSYESEKQLNEAALQAILDSKPLFTSSGSSVIEIENVSEPQENWYIATIKSINEDTATVPVSVVLREYSQSGSDLRVVLGPETDFTEAQMLQRNLPDAVILELQKS